MEKQDDGESLINLVGALTDIIWKVSKDGRVLHSNAKNAGDVFPPVTLLHKEDLPRFSQIWQTAMVSNVEMKVEVRLKSDGCDEYTWHLLRAWPVATKGDEPEHWLVICTDINTLKTTQQMFQLVMDNIPVSIFWKDRDSRYLGCNKMFASDVDKPTTEAVIGTTDYDNPSTKEESDFYVQCDKRIMESGIAESHIVEPQYRANGKQAWVDTSKIPLHDASGKIIGVLGMYEDITERVAIDQQREDFVATLTHDLKNPLIGTNRVLDLLVSGKLGSVEDSQKEILNQIKESNVSLVGMIQNLLDVYRYDAGQSSLKTDTLDLCQLLHAALNNNQMAAKAKVINLVLSINLLQPQEVASIVACAQSLGRVVQNLLDNALKFTPAGGRIDVSLSDTDSHWRIEVKDDGPGIDFDDQKSLFNRFYQGAPGKKYSHGTGLGLYLCKQIVEAHRGKIGCKSKPGHGAAFLIELPKVAPIVSPETHPNLNL